MRVPELLQKRAKIADQIKAALDKVSAEGRTCVNSKSKPRSTRWRPNSKA